MRADDSSTKSIMEKMPPIEKTTMT